MAESLKFGKQKQEEEELVRETLIELFMQTKKECVGFCFFFFFS